MRWITRLDKARADEDSPVAWIVSHAEADRWALPPPSADDLADAALAKRDGGGPRLLRRRLLRALIAHRGGVHPQQIAFGRTREGAPTVALAGLHISAAGCAGWSAVALATRPIGVDLERIGASDAPDLPAWPLTEAYLKAIGRGLAVDPGSVAVTPSPPTGFRLQSAGWPSAAGWLRHEPEVIAAVVQLA